MRTSRPAQYALEQIRNPDELYHPEIDFDTPFVRRIAECGRFPNDRPQEENQRKTTGYPDSR